ncbi:hypothetical protein LEP1GSC173_1036 [Leptospira interrogans str. HAI1594]|uniref:Uncharacterized protein n=5 Tax=Leptospira interrogans TaxID=173 RepID=M6ZMV5_LEPIR|nr:hypothetical protein G436_1571 [Leptospira interrogans serovar Hardjo str. Norma]EJP05210.1 hypothetical protein LEP1GSC007_1361 [Leptospira interrogans serovar Bulgarica str. Mallika]EKO07522.1 hypothetical protein LEP1GSC077_3227 [Leptospira interrogans str. C10069]EKO95401.1 hypothetical protein LEP1GSC057_1036 [Leptospira interrogans str. Brem 329]EKP22392.1 hypothetical protein LEP1GSC117_3787 [Leptospira interrogans serovar Icterohaemorrhagiae str. Verdun LP]EKP74797.1 hypothetical pr
MNFEFDFIRWFIRFDFIKFTFFKSRMSGCCLSNRNDKLKLY